MERTRLVEVDPFELPEWLGTDEVTWESSTGLQTGHRVHGELCGAATGDRLGCDLLAVDEAYPTPVVAEESRSHAHQAWQHGQVLVGEVEGLLALCVPGTGFDAERAMEALGRLAKAVGASSDQYAVRLRIGASVPGRPPG